MDELQRRSLRILANSGVVFCQVLLGTHLVGLDAVGIKLAVAVAGLQALLAGFMELRNFMDSIPPTPISTYPKEEKDAGLLGVKRQYLLMF